MKQIIKEVIREVALPLLLVSGLILLVPLVLSDLEDFRAHRSFVTVNGHTYLIVREE